MKTLRSDIQIESVGWHDLRASVAQRLGSPALGRLRLSPPASSRRVARGAGRTARQSPTRLRRAIFVLELVRRPWCSRREYARDRGERRSSVDKHRSPTSARTTELPKTGARKSTARGGTGANACQCTVTQWRRVTRPVQ